jgi:hypothetical protein
VGGAGDRPRRYPWWHLIVLGLAGLVEVVVWPFRRLWRSDDPIDSYALVHLGSAAGDALVAVALADTIFFSIPVGQAQGRVAAYLLLTMAPLAVAGPLLVPLLDRAGPRRAISVTSAAGRAFLALFLAPRTSTTLIFPAVFLLLVLSRVHAITKNGLVLAYAGSAEGLVRANARLGRITALAAALAAPVGVGLLRLGGPPTPIYLASAVYAVTALLNLRLPQPRIAPVREAARASGRASGVVGPRGRIPALSAPALGAVALRIASGFLLFLLAFSLRRDDHPTAWFGILVAAGLVGAFLADLLAPRLRERLREDLVVLASLLVAALAAFGAFEAFTLPMLTAFAFVAGSATELGRLAFQSLMQREATSGALGRVFVRYEVMFQVGWIVGAIVPAVLPIGFHAGILLLGAFYAAAGASYLAWPSVERRRSARARTPRGRGGAGGSSTAA